MTQGKALKPKKNRSTPYTKPKIAPAAQKSVHGDQVVVQAKKQAQKDRAKVNNTVEGWLVHKAIKDGEVFKMLKPQVAGQPNESKKLTRKEKLAKKEAAHDAIRAEIEASRQQLMPAEKAMSFDD